MTGRVDLPVPSRQQIVEPPICKLYLNPSFEPRKKKNAQVSGHTAHNT